MQSNGRPRSCSALAAAIPEEPAPMMHVRGWIAPLLPFDRALSEIPLTLPA
jgi:hypothetical protein